MNADLKQSLSFLSPGYSAIYTIQSTVYKRIVFIPIELSTVYFCTIVLYIKCSSDPGRRSSRTETGCGGIMLYDPSYSDSYLKLATLKAKCAFLERAQTIFDPVGHVFSGRCIATHRWDS